MCNTVVGQTPYQTGFRSHQQFYISGLSILATPPGRSKPPFQAGVASQKGVRRIAGPCSVHGAGMIAPPYDIAVIGLVGVGGIGLELAHSMNTIAWPQVSLIFLVILATVIVSGSRHGCVTR